jgi:hypothetical protein
LFRTTIFQRASRPKKPTSGSAEAGPGRQRHNARKTTDALPASVGAPGTPGPEDFQERESSESPMLNAFCRVAPSVLFNFLAILEAGVFLFAIDFSSRTSLEVHARRFFVLLAIEPSFQIKASCIPCGSEEKSN